MDGMQECANSKAAHLFSSTPGRARASPPCPENRRFPMLALLTGIIMQISDNQGHEAVSRPTRPGSRARRASMNQPNVVVIVCDTFRRDHIGAYGNPTIRTPHL